jgi:hypothetical protein
MKEMVVDGTTKSGTLAWEHGVWLFLGLPLKQEITQPPYERPMMRVGV